MSTVGLPSFVHAVSSCLPVPGWREEKLFAGPLVNSPRTTSYAENVEKEMTDYCLEHISRFVPKSAIFNCVSST